MKRKSSSNLSRREFLLFAETAGLAGLAAACGRRVQPVESQSLETAITSVASGSQPTVYTTQQPLNPTTPAPPAGPPDMLLFNGKVVTVDAADTIAQAVAVKDGRIQVIGSDETILTQAGPDTRRIDLAGRVLTPGLIDPHNHFRVWGVYKYAYVPFPFTEVLTLDDMQRKLAEVASQTPKGQWIPAYYWTVGKDIVPDRYDLDKVAPEHPVFMMQQAGHYATINGLALQIAGITGKTKSPPGGIIEMKGAEPTGRLYNHRAMNMVRQYIPSYTDELVEKGILEAQKVFAACGLTGYHDCNVHEPGDIDAYEKMASQGQLYLRGALHYALEIPDDLQNALTRFQPYEDPFMRFAGYKFLLDGQTTTAYCHEPHNGVSWDTCYWEPETYKKIVRILHDTGYQICVHCGGDAATDLAIDAFEAAMNANPRPDPRHRLEHAVLTTPQATQRIKDLGLIVSTNPIFIRVSGDAYLSILGEKRTQERAMVVREWLDAGIPLTFGTDAPSIPYYTPQASIASAMARLSLKNVEIGPQHRLSFPECLRAFTFSAAYAMHEDHLKGSIEPGKMADLVVWPMDPATASLAQLATMTSVDMTIVDGKVVYEA